MTAVRKASVDDAAALAALHAGSFDVPWSADEIAALIDGPGGFALVSHEAGEDTGFLLARAIAGEAEILTVAVAPHRRKLGTGRRLVEAAAEAARATGATALFLEVAIDNAAALALYGRAGFERAGLRPRYYTRLEGEPVDALLLRLSLAPA